MLILMKHKSTQIVFFSLPHRYYNAFMRLDDKKCKILAAVVLHWSKKEEKDLKKSTTIIFKFSSLYTYLVVLLEK